MTVCEICELSEFEAVCLPEPDREVCGIYVGDLLSWVMGRASEGDAWVTIMSNINIVAVASLTDVACIVLSESVSLSDDVKKVAEEKGINVLKTSLRTFEAALQIHDLNK